MSALSERLGRALRAVGLNPVEEFRFHTERKWRFDFAFPDQKVAIEVQGGAFKFGRHNRGAGAEGDWEKSNAAQLMGWVVLFFGPTHLKQGYAVKTTWTAVRNALLAAEERKKWETSVRGDTEETQKASRPTRKSRAQSPGSESLSISDSSSTAAPDPHPTKSPAKPESAIPRSPGDARS